jgi:release factor glutamine methyltransferase
MTLRELTEALMRAGIDNAAYEARLLSEHYTGIPAQVLHAAPDRPLADPDGALADAIQRRAAHYPLQYLIGTWGFWRQEYEVSPACLIPRPDTELLVEYAARHLPLGGRFIDLCTGSGCIAISILDLRADTVADAFELYPDTLEIAKKNARHNKVESRFTPVCGNVLCENTLGDKKYAAIISNPPYIRTDVIETLEAEAKKEPRAALDGGEDGLIFYRAIVKNFEKNLENDGFFLFEIGYDQAEELKEIADASGFSCEIYKDLGGCDRAALLRKK